MIDEIIKKAVEEYQCPGCVVGSDISCYEKGYNEACKRHVVGTSGYPAIGRFFLGMPRGFNRLGPCNEQTIKIFRKLEDGWTYDKFNVPVWKYKDQNGNVIVRGISPRINFPFIHVFLEDCLGEIKCLEITEKDISEMD